MSAPGHVRIMAGAYVGPLLEALEAISAEMDARHEQLHQVAQGLSDFTRLHEACKTERFDRDEAEALAERIGEGIGHV